jgi:hypothetical protein
MYICRNCNYSTNIKHNFNIHIRGKKHIELEEKILNEKKKNYENNNIVKAILFYEKIGKYNYNNTKQNKINCLTSFAQTRYENYLSIVCV